MFAAKNESAAERRNRIDSLSARRLRNVNDELTAHGANQDVTHRCRYHELHFVLGPGVRCVVAGYVVTASREKLRVHASELLEVFLEFHVLVSLTACDDADHILHDLRK